VRREVGAAKEENRGAAARRSYRRGEDGGGVRTAAVGTARVLYARAATGGAAPGNQWDSDTWRPRDRQVGPIRQLLFQFSNIPKISFHCEKNRYKCN
jgi:hypothetical protein